METQTAPLTFPKKADKKRLLEVLDEVEKRMGIEYDPTATPEGVQASMIRNGIRPEDNILSREILQMRYGTDDNEE